MRPPRTSLVDAAATAVWLVALFGGLLVFLQCLKIYRPYLNDDPLIWELPLACYLPGLVVTILFRKKLFLKEPLSAGLRVLGIMILPLAPAAAGVSLFFFLNGYLDTSTPHTVPYAVLYKHRYKNEFSLDVRSIQKPPFKNSIAVDEKTYDAARVGSRVAVAVKSGYFNTPWVVAYQLDDSSATDLNENAKNPGKVYTAGTRAPATAWETFRPKNTLEWLMAVTLGVFLIGVGGVDVWLLHRIARYMQAKHPVAWAALHTRSPYTLTFTSFIRSKDYLSLNDSNLTRMFEFKTRFDNRTGILFIAVMALLLYFNGHGN